MRETAESATRKRLTWNGLTPRSATQTGDVIDVWTHNEDRSRRGIYLGFCDCLGMPHAEIESLESEGEYWCWRPDDPVTIRLVIPSLSIVTEPFCKPLPATPRDQHWFLLLVLGGCAAWLTFFLWAFWR